VRKAAICWDGKKCRVRRFAGEVGDSPKTCNPHRNNPSSASRKTPHRRVQPRFLAPGGHPKIMGIYFANLRAMSWEKAIGFESRRDNGSHRCGGRCRESALGKVARAASASKVTDRDCRGEARVCRGFAFRDLVMWPAGRRRTESIALPGSTLPGWILMSWMKMRLHGGTARARMRGALVRMHSDVCPKLIGPRFRQPSPRKQRRKEKPVCFFISGLGGPTTADRRKRLFLLGKMPGSP